MLEQVDEGGWITEGNCADFHGFAYPTRSVVARLRSGALWVWSPIALSEKLRNDIGRIGTPGFLVSPNKIHHLFLTEWPTAWPQAKLYGPASTIAKPRDLQFLGNLGNRDSRYRGGSLPSWPLLCRPQRSTPCFS